MKRLLAGFIVPALAALGVAVPAFAGNGSFVAVDSGVVVYVGGHRWHVKRGAGLHHRKPGIHRPHRLSRGKLHHGKLRHGKLRHGKLRHGKLHRGKLHRGKLRHEKLHHGKRWRAHDRRAATLHRRPLSRHFSQGRHRAKGQRWHRRSRQFFFGHGMSSRYHGPRFSSGRRMK